MLTEAVHSETEQTRVAVRTVAATRPVVTVEKALYGLFVLLALLPRLIRLDVTPLDAHEAGQALAAHRLATGAGEPTGAYSPLLLTFHFIMFALIGAGDTMARLLPALAGAALVATPYWMRRWLGRQGGLATAALLALSPSFVVFSRQVDEAIVTAALTLALLAVSLRFLAGPTQPRLMWGALWLGLALTSGRGAWLAILVSAGFMAAVTLSGRDSVTREDILAAWRWFGARREGTIGAALLATGTFIVVSTAVYFNPGGLQAALDTLAAWGRVPQDTVRWTHYLLVLPLYETLTLVVGVLGGLWLLRQRNMFALFLLLWFVVALGASLLTPARPPSGVLTFLLPLTLLAGMALGRFVEELLAEGGWDREGLLILFAFPFIVGPALQLANYATLAVVAPGVSTRLLLVVVLFVVFILAVVSTIASLLGRAVAVRGFVLLVVLVLGMATLRSGVAVAFPQAYVPQEFLGGPQTSPDVTMITELVRARAVDRFGARRTETVMVDERLTPTLLWYLRQSPRVETRQNVTAGPPSAPHLLAYLPPNAQPPLVPGFVGQRARYETRWTPEGLDARAWLRWYIYREVPAKPAVQDSIIWFAKP